LSNVEEELVSTGETTWLAVAATLLRRPLPDGVGKIGRSAIVSIPATR
jgi:hypothetical protein